jgi:hypothetical protein
MQDILKKYRKNKITTNINIILASLVLAIWINFLLIDWTNIWQSLKTSVLNSEIQNNKSDLSIEKIENSIYIISNKKIEKLDSLSFWLSYNPENINIINIKSDLWDIINLSNTPWFNSIILSTTQANNINIWDKIAKLDISKIIEKTENINILNANFKDINQEKYSLSTSWITF